MLRGRVMQWSNFGLLGIFGVLAFFAGAHLLWSVRVAAIAWLVEFIHLLGAEFARRHASVSGERLTGSTARPRSGTLALAAALTLILIGPILIFLDLTAF